MSFKFRHLEKIVGFFMLFGILILLVAIIMIGRQQRWFEKKFLFNTVFNTGNNLSSGMDVKINGLVVGQISKVGFSADNRISVGFYVYEEYIDKVKTDTYVFKESSSPLGGGFLKLTIGTTNGQNVTNRTFLSSQDSLLVQQLLEQGLIPQEESSLGQIIKNINLLTAQLSSPRGPLIGSLANVQQLTAKLANGKGTLHSLAVDNKLYQDLVNTVDTLDKMANDLSVFSGVLRTYSPNVRNLITSAEKSAQDALKVMSGLQQYFRTQNATPGTVNTSMTQQPATVIQLDRRSLNY